MADKKISALTAATTPLAGTEVLPIVQSNVTVKVATNDLTVKNVRSNATTGILQVAGPTAGATRVMTTPDANFSAARIDAAQTFTGVQSFTSPAIADTAAYTGTINTVSDNYSARTAIMQQNDTLTINNISSGVIEICESAFWENIALIGVTQASTTIIYRSDTNITVTSGNAGTINVYRSGANVIIESKNGAGLSVRTNIRKLG